MTMSMTASHAEHGMQRMHTVKDVGMKVSTALHDAVLSGGEPVRHAVDALHGKWLGHPLHPVLTDLVIGSWVMGGICDAIGAARDSDGARKAGDRLATLGTIAAAPTALTGLADFSTFPEWSATPATLHAGGNVLATGLYTWSIIERRRGNRNRGVLLSTLALGLSCVTAWLGGVLVYKHKVGVDHSDRFTGPQEWTSVLEEYELPDRQPKRIDFEGKPIMLYREGQTVYALGATCSHAGGPLDEGQFHGHCVQCPWHDSVFDMADGRVAHGPATQPQPAFAARLRDGQVQIRILRPWQEPES